MTCESFAFAGFRLLSNGGLTFKRDHVNLNGLKTSQARNLGRNSSSTLKSAATLLPAPWDRVQSAHTGHGTNAPDHPILKCLRCMLRCEDSTELSRSHVIVNSEVCAHRTRRLAQRPTGTSTRAYTTHACAKAVGTRTVRLQHVATCSLPFATSRGERLRRGAALRAHAGGYSRPL